MEVKIKKGTELIPATIEMVDGNMIVFPQVDEFIPKDGDIVFVKGGVEHILIYKEKTLEYIVAYVDFIDNECLSEVSNAVHLKNIVDLRPATEKEMQKLFDKLKEKGLAWDAEKRELVKLKWKPVLSEVYFRVEFVDDEFRYADWNWKNSTYEINAYERGWCFKNEEECQSFCDKLNQAIDSVKP